MSLSIEEAKRTLNIMECYKNDPKLLLTNEIPNNSLIYTVKLDGKVIFDYLIEYLYTLEIFQGCNIKNKYEKFLITTYPLRYGKYAKFISDDKIIIFDIIEHKYKIINNDINEYEKIMNENYVLKTKELDKFWECFVDLSLKKRIKNAIKALKTKKKIHIRILDFIFWLKVRKKTIKDMLNVKYEEIKTINQNRIEEYYNNINKQKYYIQYAPKHINNIKCKQKEIAEYLQSLGYVEDENMSVYL